MTAPPHEQWRELVADVGSLITTTYDGIEIEPLYDRSLARTPYIGPERGWDVRQRHAHPDPATARQAIRADLENGVTSLWLVLGDGSAPVRALAGLLEGAGVPVVLDAGVAAAEAAEALLALGPVRGNLGVTRTDDAVRLARRCIQEFPDTRAITVDGLPYHNSGAADAQELGCTIAAGVGYLRALTDAGLGIDDALGQLEFRYAATADQFATIAKFRAARLLWARVAAECGAGRVEQVQHAVTSSPMMTRRDPYVNMLRTTLACFGAGIGGAGAVTVQPFDAALGLPDDFSRRIARNTQSLLQQESNLSRVADPAGGSGYVESLTTALAERAWSWFQEIERAGGVAAASGLIAERIAEVRERRFRDIAHRRAPITGVSEFPAPRDHGINSIMNPLACTTTPGIHDRIYSMITRGLPRIRYAQPYEEIRDRAEAAGAKIYLATLGPLAAYTARERFAANLFQAGGIQTVTGPPEGFAGSGCAVACLCSSDDQYESDAARAARELRVAGATRIWLAGRGEYPDIDGNIYAGCDAIDVLETTLRDLGVPR